MTNYSENYYRAMVRLARDESERRRKFEEENQTLRVAVANLRVQNAKLKFWLHRAGISTVDGERIEGE